MCVKVNFCDTFTIPICAFEFLCQISLFLYIPSYFCFIFRYFYIHFRFLLHILLFLYVPSDFCHISLFLCVPSDFYFTFCCSYMRLWLYVPHFFLLLFHYPACQITVPAWFWCSQYVAHIVGCFFWWKLCILCLTVISPFFYFFYLV